MKHGALFTDSDPTTTRVLTAVVVSWAMLLITFLAFWSGKDEALKTLVDPVMLLITGAVLGYGGIRSFDRHSARRWETESFRSQRDRDVGDDEEADETTTVNPKSGE